MPWQTRPTFNKIVLCGEHLCGNFLCGGRIDQLSVLARRDIAKKTIYRVKGNKQEQYDYVVPGNPRTFKQQYNRWKMKIAVLRWHQLSPAEHQEWENSVPKHRVMSGFNYYVSEYIKSSGGGFDNMPSRNYIQEIPAFNTMVPAMSASLIHTVTGPGLLNEVLMRVNDTSIKLRILLDDIEVFNQSFGWFYDNAGLAIKEIDVGVLQVYRNDLGNGIYGVRIKFDSSYFLGTIKLYWNNETGGGIGTTSLGSISYGIIL